MSETGKTLVMIATYNEIDNLPRLVGEILAEAPQFQSSGELPVINPDRAADIDLKHEAIGLFLRENRYAALLLRRPSNLSWFSSGADFPRPAILMPPLWAASWIKPSARCRAAPPSLRLRKHAFVPQRR